MTSVPFIANTGFDKDKGMAALASGEVDAVSYGALFLANPHLVARFATDDEGLNQTDRATFYGVGPKGYTDYPARGAGRTNAA